MLLSQLVASLDYTDILNGTDRPLDRIDISAICYDSRKTYNSALFVCIKGSQADGHSFAASAYVKMCRVFVAEHKIDNLPDDVVLIIVKDTRMALAKLADCFYDHPSSKLRMIGITGTKGKTTSCLLIYNLLNANGIKTGYIGSNGVYFDDKHFSTINTTPESYDLHYYMSRMVEDGVNTLVMEVSSQALKQYRVYGIKFDVTVFTNLHPDHIGEFEHPDFEDYKNAKRSLFTDYDTDVIVYNADDQHHTEMIGGIDCEKLGFAIDNPDADFKASRITYIKAPGMIGVKFECSTDGQKFPVSLSFPGEFSVYNAMTALAVCRRLQLPLEGLLKTMPKIKIKGRFETIELPNGATAIIDYAHNGVSMKAALAALRVYDPHRLICVFGSIGGRTSMRRAELGLVASRDADFCVITSDNPDQEPPASIMSEIASYFTLGSCPYIAIPDRKTALLYALENSESGDIILFAGKGHENYQLIGGVREYFSESEIITQYCEKLKANVE